MASGNTVVLKKKGDRGGVLPGSGNGAGKLPYNAITGGQSGARPVETRASMQSHLKRIIGYGEH